MDQSPLHALSHSLDLLRDTYNYNHWIYSLLRNYLGEDICEVGAGTGNLTQFFLNSRRMLCIEPEAEYCQALRKLAVIHRNLELHPCGLDNCDCIGQYAKAFDSVVCVNVLEHIADDCRAIEQMNEMLREGGRFLLTVPFLFRVHANPTDCTRWTPQGLAYFLEEGGFSRDKMRVGAWGNRACVKASLAGRNYCRRLHSLENEPDYPVVVWALAQKGEAS